MARYLTVSALNRYLKFKMDSDSELQSILLRAEISNFKRHSRGHLYMTLKDNESQVSAVMFSSHTNKLNFAPSNGDKVLIEGYVSVYEAYGSYQVYITKMDQDGVGELYLAYEKLKKDLDKEGLFNKEIKKSLPKIPLNIGVITSPTGAAIKDIINVIQNRFKLSRIILYPASVQGQLAKTEIISQIKKANQDKLVDVLIVGRGGGSIEDLWPFNEESVARAIFDSKIPIISAVGHETDFTIADFVSDFRASTPSHAAEIVVPHHLDLLNQINQSQDRLQLALKNKHAKQKAMFLSVMRHPLLKQPLRLIQKQEEKYTFLYERLLQNHPKRIIDQHLKDVISYRKKLDLLYKHQFQTKHSTLNTLIEKLDLVSPLHIMKKGFALVEQEKKFIKSVKEIHQSKNIDIHLHDGKIRCKILEMRGKNNE